MNKNIIPQSVKNDITIYGIINIGLYLFVCFFLLPLIQYKFKIKISLLNYLIWYIWSLAYTGYIIYIIYKDKNKRSEIENITYDLFIKGGLKSYQNTFLFSEKEPLFEYGILFSLILLPVSNTLSYTKKLEIILVKIGIFHLITSLLLMDWKTLIVDYKFRKVSNISNTVK